MENVIIGSWEIFGKGGVGVKSTSCVVSTGVLTFPESVISFKVVEEIVGYIRLVFACWVVAWGSARASTGAQAFEDVRHEFVARAVIPRKETMNFFRIKKSWLSPPRIIFYPLLSVELYQFC